MQYSPAATSHANTVPRHNKPRLPSPCSFRCCWCWCDVEEQGGQEEEGAEEDNDGDDDDDDDDEEEEEEEAVT